MEIIKSHTADEPLVIFSENSKLLDTSFQFVKKHLKDLKIEILND